MAVVARCLVSLGFRRLCSSERRRDFQRLREIVVDGAGGLDEMESALNELEISVTPSVAAEIFESAGSSGAATRRLLRFFSWSRRRSSAEEEDFWWGDPFREAIRCFSAAGDASAVGIVISDLLRRRRQMPPDVFAFAAESLVKLSRPDDVIRLLSLHPGEEEQRGRMILAAVHALCGGGPPAAAKVVARHGGELSPAEMTAARRYLLHGWCNGKNAREARKMIEEIKSSGEAPGGAAYHALLRCLCQRNLKFNAAALLPEAFSIAAEMRAAGEPVTAATVNVLLRCLVKARRVKESWNVLQSMRRGENGRPPPDWVSYFHVTRVMFLTGRWVRGMRVVRQMAEDGVAAPPGFYCRLVGLLCGVEKVEFALEVFDELRERGFRGEEVGEVYDMLIEKLCRGGRFEEGRRLWKEAAATAVPLRSSSELLDPLKTEVFEPCRCGDDEDEGFLKKKKKIIVKKVK